MKFDYCKTECGGVINELCIGYVEKTKPPEELAHSPL